jgi:hypothetical protein
MLVFDGASWTGMNSGMMEIALPFNVVAQTITGNSPGLR